MLSSRIPNTKAAVGGVSGKLRYFSLVEQASLQQYPSQRNQTPIDVYDDNVRNTWLCVACFHGRGNHNHYQVPIRVGGGYSICHFNHLQWFPSSNAEATWKTIRWLLNAGLPQGKRKTEQLEVKYGDDYTSLLYHQFIQHGGNRNALQDYLESNFDQDVLDDLADSGVDVAMIKDYTDRFRSYINTLLANNNNNKKQEKRVQRWAKQLTMAVLCEKLDEAVKKFDNLREVDLQEEDVASLLTQVVRHLFINETSAFVRKLSENVKSVATEEKNLKKVHAKIKKWVKKHNGVENQSTYEAAVIFKEYIEEGGRIHHMQEYISNIENRKMYLTQFGEDYKEIVKKYAELMVDERANLEAVMDFPDAPQLVRAYLDCGGDYKLMLNAISVYLGSPEFAVTVEEKLQAILSNLFHEHIALTSKLKEKRQRIINHVLVPLIEKTKVEFLQNRFYRLERRLNNEGGLLLQILKQNLVENDDRNKRQAADASRNLTTIIYKHISDRKKLWVTPKPFEIRRNHDVQLTVPQIPFSNHRFYNIESLTEDHILDIEKKERRHLEFLRRGLQIPKFQQTWQVRVSSPLGSLVSEASFQNHEGLRVLINGKIPTKENKKSDKQLRRDRQRLKMIRAKKKKMDNLSIPPTPFALHECRPNITPASTPVSDFDDDEDGGARSIIINLPPTPHGIEYRHSRKHSATTLTDSGFHHGTPEPFSSISSMRSSVTNSPDNGIKLDSRSDSMTSAQPVVSVENIDSIRLGTGRRKSKKARRHRLKAETKSSSNKLKSKSWSGIPPSFMYEGFEVDNDPTTAVERVQDNIYNVPTNIYSNNRKEKSWEEFENLQTISSPKEDASKLLTKAKDRMERMQEKRKSILHKYGSPITQQEEEDSEEDDDVPSVHEDEDDILKYYSIIRSQRVETYRKIFERYAILKEIQDKKDTTPEPKSDETLDYELAKVDMILHRIHTNIEQCQEKVITTKGRIHCATACIARIKYNDLIFSEEHVNEISKQPLRRRRRNDEMLMMNDRAESATAKTTTPISDTETLKLLTSEMRRKCEKYKEVRDLKLALIQVRSQLKVHRARLVAATDRRHNLAQHIEAKKVARGISCLRPSYVGKTTNISRKKMKNGSGEEVGEHMLSVDVKNALLDVNPKFSAALLDWEDLQQEDVRQGISGGGGELVAAINFRTFAVICALYEIGEDERDFGVLTRSRSLDGKLKWCKLYYKRLLGPDRRVLESDLLASGMTSRQCSAIVDKLASREQGIGELDFMEFVAHLPLFMEGHQHIVRSPLGC